MRNRIICTVFLTACLCLGVNVFAQAAPTHSKQTLRMTSQSIPAMKYTDIESLIKYKDPSQAAVLEPAKQQVIAAIKKNVPMDMVNYFREHHGSITLGYFEGSVGYTEFAVDNDNKPMIPDTVFPDCPMNMYISCEDAAYGYLDDYVTHEFGHVFDARYRITKNPANDAIVSSEMAGVIAANAETSVDSAHYATTPEAFAQIYASYKGGTDIVSGDKTKAAAPKTIELIKQYEGGNR